MQWMNCFGQDVVNEKYGVDRLIGKAIINVSSPMYTISGMRVGKYAMFFFHGASRPQKP